MVPLRVLFLKKNIVEGKGFLDYIILFCFSNFPLLELSKTLKFLKALFYQLLYSYPVFSSCVQHIKILLLQWKFYLRKKVE